MSRPKLIPETVRMLRVPAPPEPPTNEISLADHVLPRYDEEDQVYDHEDTDDFVVNRPGNFKDRHIQYMTAAVLWFMLACVLAIIGAVVWKIVSAVAS